MSLLETILALFLLALMVLMLANLFPSSVLTARRGETRVEADLLAESILAEQMTRPFDELVLGPPTDLSPVAGEGGMTFLPTLEIFQVDTRDVTYLKGLRVTVRWQRQEHKREVVHEVWVPNLKR